MVKVIRLAFLGFAFLCAAPAWAAEPVRLGFQPQGSAVKMVRKWQPFADYLAGALGRPVEIVIRGSYREVAEALARGEIDVCLTGSFLYVQARAELGIQPLVKRVIQGHSSYSSLIVVRRDSGITSVEGLRGKRFAFTDRDSTSGYLLPVAHLSRMGFPDPSAFFSETIFTGNHDSALLAVYMGAADAAAFSTTRWRSENPRIGDFAILWRSEPITLGPFSVRRDIDRTLARHLKTAFLAFGKDSATRSLAAQLDLDGFEEARDEEYESVRRIRQELQRQGITFR